MRIIGIDWRKNQARGKPNNLDQGNQLFGGWRFVVAKQ